MTRTQWKRAISKLPKGMSYKAVSDLIGQPYHSTRIWMIELGYKISGNRKQGHWWRRKELIERLADVDWEHEGNIDIARRKNLSKERVRQIRKFLNKPFCETRGRRNNSH